VCGLTELLTRSVTVAAATFQRTRFRLGRNLKIKSFEISSNTNCPRQPVTAALRSFRTKSYWSSLGHVSLAGGAFGEFHSEKPDIWTLKDEENELAVALFNGFTSPVKLSINILVEREL